MSRLSLDLPFGQQQLVAWSLQRAASAELTSRLCEVIDAHRRFGAVAALAGVSLEVSEGEILGVVGPNGSGKTTLFNCISGLLPLSSGSILWRGQVISKWPMNRIAKLGLVRTFQQSMHFGSATVRDNLVMALDIGSAARRSDRPKNIPVDVEGFLQFTGLEELASSPSSALSHGSLRQLGIGLALAAQPQLLLLDEPAAGLNDQETAVLTSLLLRIRDLGVSLIVVDHDMGFVMPLVHRLIVLSAGLKLAEGRPEDIRTDPSVIEVYLGGGFAKKEPESPRGVSAD